MGYSAQPTRFAASSLPFLRRNEPPRFANMRGQLFIADAGKLDTDPSTHTHVRRPEKYFRRGMNEHFLQPRRRGYPDGDVAVVMVIVRKHRKHLFADKECRLAVREFFRTLRHCRADSPDAP